MRLTSGVLLVLGSMEASARCLPEWLEVSLARGTKVPATVQVLVTVGGSYQRMEPRFEFVAGKARVAGEVVSTFAGHEQQLTVVKPASALAVGAWELTVTFTKPDPARGPPPSRQRFGPWKVSAGEPPMPEFAAAPSVKTIAWEALGCGPAAVIDVSGTLSAPGHVEAVMTVPGQPPVTAVLATRDGVIELGHGMCNGAFTVPPKVAASVVLTPLDLSGRRGASATALTFTTPGPTP